MLLSKSVEAVDGIAERSGLSDIFPGESSKARYQRANISFMFRILGRRIGRHRDQNEGVFLNNQGKEGDMPRTAKRSDRGVDWFDKDTLAVNL